MNQEAEWEWTGKKYAMYADERTAISARIMAGIAASPDQCSADEAARISVKWADALIAELAKGPSGNVATRSET